MFNIQIGPQISDHETFHSAISAAKLSLSSIETLYHVNSSILVYRQGEKIMALLQAMQQGQTLTKQNSSPHISESDL